MVTAESEPRSSTPLWCAMIAGDMFSTHKRESFSTVSVLYNIYRLFPVTAILCLSFVVCVAAHLLLLHVLLELFVMHFPRKSVKSCALPWQHRHKVAILSAWQDHSTAHSRIGNPKDALHFQWTKRRFLVSGLHSRKKCQIHGKFQVRK